MNWILKLLGIDVIKSALSALAEKQKADYQELRRQINEVSNSFSDAAQDLQEQISELNRVVFDEPPQIEDDWSVPEWAVKKYINPQITRFDDGIVWAKFIKGDGDITQLRLPYWNNGKDKPPIIEPPSISSGLRVPLQDGAVFLAYRNPFQADGTTAVELCDPPGYCIEFKWTAWLGNSSTGREPGEHGL